MNMRPLVSVIDDDESVRESLPHLLKTFGFAVRAFSSAEEYLRSDEISQSKCLALDINMPGMSGPDLFQELKRLGWVAPVAAPAGRWPELRRDARPEVRRRSPAEQCA